MNDDLRQTERAGAPISDLPSHGQPDIPDHQLLRRVGEGSYGEVWLARNVMGTYRAVKVVFRRNFSDDRPYEREFSGIEKFEPLSRTHEGLVDVLQVGRNDRAGYFYYVMELADDASAPGEFDANGPLRPGLAPGKSTSTAPSSPNGTPALSRPDGLHLRAPHPTATWLGHWRASCGRGAGCRSGSVWKLP